MAVPVFLVGELCSAGTSVGIGRACVTDQHCSLLGRQSGVSQPIDSIRVFNIKRLKPQLAGIRVSSVVALTECCARNGTKKTYKQKKQRRSLTEFIAAPPISLCVYLTVTRSLRLNIPVSLISTKIPPGLYSKRLQTPNIIQARCHIGTAYAATDAIHRKPSLEHSHQRRDFCGDPISGRNRSAHFEPLRELSTG